MKKKEKISGEAVNPAPAENENAMSSAEAEQPAEEAVQAELPAGADADETPEEAPVRDAEKLARDVAAFHELFPDVKAEEIPGEVWEQVEAGESLTAAYAVHFVKAKRDRERIEKLNAENEKAAPPPVRHDGKEESYFSPEAVKAMSREEVRKNYREILRSMDHWN